MKGVSTLKAAVLLMPLFVSACATTLDIPVIVPGGKGDLKMERISIYPVKDSNNRRELPVATQELEAMLVNTEVNGKAVFDVLAIDKLGSIQAQQQIERQALRGSFDQSTVNQFQAKGVQGLIFTILKETSSNENSSYKSKGKTVNCLSRKVVSTFYPKIVRTADARVAVQDEYSGEATKTSCDGVLLNDVNEELAQKARAEALQKMRRDVAPYTRNMEATILTNFCGNGKFGNLVNKTMKGSSCDSSQPTEKVIELVEGGDAYAKKGRLDQACDRWNTASSLHDEGFIVPYLRGVCAEVAENNIAAASEFYRQADAQTTRPVDVISNALKRISMKAAEKKIVIRGGDATQKPVRRPDAVVLSVQQALVDWGYDPGAPDGFMGGQTEKAIEMFQEDNGLAVTGQIDAATKSELDM